MPYKETKTAATLILIFLSCACQQRQSARGFSLDIADAPESCGDGREIVLVAVGGGNAKLNAEPTAGMEKIAHRLHEINSTRAVKLVYVKAEPDVSWGDFMETVDHAWPETQVLSFLTPHVDAMARHHGCLEPSRNTAHPPYSLH